MQGGRRVALRVSRKAGVGTGHSCLLRGEEARTEVPAEGPLPRSQSKTRGLMSPKCQAQDPATTT